MILNVDFIKHHLQSHSRHGTHSPFVYALADEIIYREISATERSDLPMALRQLPSAPLKKIIILSRMLQAFSYDQFTCHAEGMAQEELFTQNLRQGIKRHFYYTDRPEDLPAFLQAAATTDIIFVENIHQNPLYLNIWKDSLQHNKVTVAVDLYYFGLLFFRTEQKKEAFKLRFP